MYLRETSHDSSNCEICLRVKTHLQEKLLLTLLQLDLKTVIFAKSSLWSVSKEWYTDLESRLLCSARRTANDEGRKRSQKRLIVNVFM